MKHKSSSLSNLTFLKLGGSLITEKSKPRKPRKDLIMRLGREIRTSRIENNGLRLVLGHGSGSFGHVPARKYGTRLGVRTPAEWLGFSEVWYEAFSLNRIVIETFQEVKLPVISFPASAGVISRDGKVSVWNLGPLNTALEVNLLPVVYGDVAFDTHLGGTILSTEDIFTHLAEKLKPGRILLAGIDEAVYADYPACKTPIPEITPENWGTVEPLLGGSSATDVTGGMASKVEAMMGLAVGIPGLEVVIFSGYKPGNLISALKGYPIGTRISSEVRRK